MVVIHDAFLPVKGNDENKAHFNGRLNYVLEQLK